MADDLQDLERFVRDFALFQQRFLDGQEAAVTRRAPAATQPAPCRPLAAQPPSRTA